MTKQRYIDDIDTIKSQASETIRKRILAMGITQQQAADLAGMNRSDLNGLLNGKLRGHSLSKLLRAALALGMSVDVRLGA